MSEDHVSPVKTGTAASRNAGSAAFDPKSINDGNRVIVFDTTLRDGEQSPGYSMNTSQKLRMARDLAALNVDVIEAGFAAASPGDFEAVERIATEISGPTICSLARASLSDIRAAGRAIQPAARRRIHVFLATSPIHREHKLQMSRSQVLKAAVEAITEARQWTNDVEFSPEDGIRTEHDFLAEVIEAVIDAGATTINVPDTVGYTTPGEIYDLFRFFKEEIPNIEQAILSTHCHNDLGMAVANSLAALRAGARQVECTINGIGERAGNASLEEAVMALKVRGSFFKLDTQVETRHLHAISTLLCDMTGNAVARNKAVVGRNAFAHEAGIHQHGMLANRETYEIMKPEDIGLSESSLVLGKHSGKHALQARCRQLGFSLSDTELKSVFAAFKDLADTRREVLDTDLETLILQMDGAGERLNRASWRLVGLDCAAGTVHMPQAVVDLEDPYGVRHRDSAKGMSAFDAAVQAIARITDYHLTVDQLTSRVERDSGEDGRMISHADVRVRHGDKVMAGSASHTDGTTASIQAVMAVVNQIERREHMEADSTPAPAPHAAREAMPA